MLSNNFDIIKNQPITFTGSGVQCVNTNDIEYKTLVNADDTTQVQFKIRPRVDALQLITNWDFATNASGWTLINMSWDNGQIVNDYPSSATSGYMSLPPDNLQAPFGENALMYVAVKVDVNVTGFAIIAGTKSLAVPAGQTGVFSLYGMYSDTDNETAITYTLPSTGAEGLVLSVDYVKAYPVDYNYIFLIRNLSDNTVVTGYPLYLRLNGDNPTGIEPFRLAGNNLTWTIDWSDLELQNGCYQLEVCDPRINTNLQNGFPNQDFNYFDDTDLDFDGGNVVASFQGDSTILISHVAGLAGTFSLSTDVAPVAGLTYNYQIVFSDVDLSGGGITMGIGFTGDSDSVNITASGTYTGSFVSDGGQMSLNLVLSSNASCRINVARVYLQNENDYQGNYISSKFKIVNDDCNTVVLHGCSDVDYTFGLNFGSSSYTLRSRVEGKLVNPQYSFDKSSYMYGTYNNTRTAYFMRKKVKNLKLALLPEYMLDFVSALIGLDHIYIDNVEYQLNGEEFFTLSYDNNLDNAGHVTLQLIEVDSTLESKARVALGVGCSDDIDCVLDPENDLCLIDPETGDPLISLEQSIF